MRLYDVSMPICEEMPVYKNRSENRPKLTVDRDFSQGARETRLTLNMHTGTHVDAPFHFLPGGEKIHTVPIENMVRPCRVLDFTHVADRITSSELEGQSIEPGDFILFKTRNSLVNGFDPNYVFLDVDGAEHLVERKIRGVGIDALSIGRGQPNPEIHRLLLKERIVIIEGLRLAEVPKGKYLLIAAPLAVVDAEAAPARVILAQMEGNATP